MSNYLWLLDAGHGGIKNGAYTTAPGKMFIFPDAVAIFEGVVNREITRRLRRKLIENNIDFIPVYDEIEDTSLITRTNLANSIFSKDRRAVYLSIHCNSIFPNLGGGKGFELFTFVGQNKSDIIAQIFGTTYKNFFPEFPFRADIADGDLDKEMNLHVLRETNCPALLIENLFFDNKEEAIYLLSDRGLQSIADCLLSCIKNVERLKPITQGIRLTAANSRKCKPNINK